MLVVWLYIMGGVMWGFYIHKKISLLADRVQELEQEIEEYEEHEEYGKF